MRACVFCIVLSTKIIFDDADNLIASLRRLRLTFEKVTYVYRAAFYSSRLRWFTCLLQVSWYILEFALLL